MQEDGPILVTKLDAARRQLRTAIRLWFADGDPVSIHTLAAASHEIIHTLYRREGLTDLLFDSTAIRDDRRKDWSKVLKDYAGFFKHADRDPTGQREFHPFSNEVFLLVSVFAVAKMGHSLSLEERAFSLWSFVHRPDCLIEGAKDEFPIETVEQIKRIAKDEFLDFVSAIRRP